MPAGMSQHDDIPTYSSDLFGRLSPLHIEPLTPVDTPLASTDTGSTTSGRSSTTGQTSSSSGRLSPMPLARDLSLFDWAVLHSDAVPPLHEQYAVAHTNSFELPPQLAHASSTAGQQPASSTQQSIIATSPPFSFAEQRPPPPSHQSLTVVPTSSWSHNVSATTTFDSDSIGIGTVVVPATTTRRAKHTAKDRRRRQDLSQLQAELKDLVSLHGQTDQRAVLRAAIDELQRLRAAEQRRFQQQAIAATHSASNSIPPALSNTGVQSEWTTLTNIVAQQMGLIVQHLRVSPHLHYSHPQYKATEAYDSFLHDRSVPRCYWFDRNFKLRDMSPQMAGHHWNETKLLGTYCEVMNPTGFKPLPSLKEEAEALAIPDTTTLRKPDPVYPNAQNGLFYALVRYNVPNGQRNESVVGMNAVYDTEGALVGWLVVGNRSSSRVIHPPRLDAAYDHT